MATAAPRVTPDAIFQLAQGFMASKLFFTAGNIGLFEQLAGGPATVDELAARTKATPRGVLVVANAMVALGMLALENGRYRNSETAQAFLAGKGPADMRSLLTFWDRISYPAWIGLTDATKSDDRSHGFPDFTPEEQAIFSAGVEAASTGGAMALAASYDFGRCRRVLDIGGGTGSFLKIVRRHHPHVEAGLFELSGAAAYARSRFTPDDAAHISVIEGDMMKDALPGGYDAMLMSHVLHAFSVEQNRALLKRVHDAAEGGTRLLIVDFFLDETRTQPVPAVLMSGEFLTQTNGRSYSVSEVRELAGQIGWRFVEHRGLAGPVSLLVLEK